MFCRRIHRSVNKGRTIYILYNICSPYYNINNIIVIRSFDQNERVPNGSFGVDGGSSSLVRKNDQCMCKCVWYMMYL